MQKHILWILNRNTMMKRAHSIKSLVLNAPPLHSYKSKTFLFDEDLWLLIAVSDILCTILWLTHFITHLSKTLVTDQWISIVEDCTTRGIALFPLSETRTKKVTYSNRKSSCNMIN
ncbi:hypothetical protein CEXT_719201 [Caerostris extrusa]|uniref:Uncharacterized protein n=1 Tax=Caerostris extrusa TaxID=172846 RepID=A0AAV4TEZ3_CAEEX|nr:hypothetical protein CEXT_719201 [Caerostris extrusa]